MSGDSVNTAQPTRDIAATLGATRVSSDSSIPPSPAESVETGTIIGRYVVLSKLGAGAMGVVFAAYDPELDRKVALKLLLARPGAQDAASARLQREAQALAKLDHRNVVGVYDVGMHEGQLFVGMEFVQGQTLGDWMSSVDEPRPWQEIVRVFTEAGHGLAAAHEAGLVHRDFKPDNVMLGSDGRVRVMDFGLARRKDDERDRNGEVDDAAGSGKHRHLALTQVGAMLGTPAYMPMEQFEGQEADARSDQFSFCVALYEALYGERPFAGDSIAALILSVGEGEIREPTKRTRVPAWLRKVVVRGLAVDPSARWPSMAALLAALADDPALRRRKWWAAAMAVGLLGGAVWGTWYAVQVDASTCEGFEARLEGVWDDARRADVEAAIEATKLSYAAATWVRVQERLDDYTRAWVAARAQACEATHNGEQSGELLDLRMACLDERLQHVRATVDVLAAADETVVNNAVEAVMGLPTLERCADVNALTAEQPPPEDPTVAARVIELDAQLIDAKALENAGKYTEGLSMADAVVREAAALDYEPLQARAWLLQGQLQERTGDAATAEATLDRSYEAAVSLQMAAEAAAASTSLVWVVGNPLARHDEARRWAKEAKLWARAAGTDQARADYSENLGAVAIREGKYDEARDHYERALEITEKSLGLDHPDVAAILNNLGIVAELQGKYDEARDHLERALAITQQALGPDHPDVGLTLISLGNVAQREGKIDEARGHFERALVITEEALGPDHPDLAAILNNLGILAAKEEKYDEAKGYYERALRIWEKAMGADHPYSAAALNGLGNVAKKQGNLAEARTDFERALAIWEKALGPDHPNVAAALDNLGTVAQEEGKYDEARSYYERALATWEKALGPDHPDVAYPLVGIGVALLDRGNADEALPPLERALTIRTANEATATDLAEIRFALARALWDAKPDSGRDRERAKTLAELARAAYEQAGEDSAKQLEEVQLWQREHAS